MIIREWRASHLAALERVLQPSARDEDLATLTPRGRIGEATIFLVALDVVVGNI